MKIPDAPAPADIGAYYGNDENGQWQPNGVIIDSGVGGGVVGSGDAGVHRAPVYPVHIPRGHVPGYVMAGAYYPPAYPPPQPPAPQDDFADYMWMENEEEFDKQVMQQLEEEALMEQCIEAMLEDQQREQRASPSASPSASASASNGPANNPTSASNGSGSLSLEETVSRSTLNPLAAEFVPTRRPQPPQQPQQQQPAEDKPEATEAQPAVVPKDAAEASAPRDEAPAASEREGGTRGDASEADASEGAQRHRPAAEPAAEPPAAEPPEVSAAGVLPIAERRPRDSKRTPPVKQQEAKRKEGASKPTVGGVAAVKSDSKVQAPVKKKEPAKLSKSETTVERVEERSTVEEVSAALAACGVETDKQSTPPLPLEDSTPSGPKPINYAAAAKANKPKKPSSPPIVDKTSPQPQVTAVKADKSTPAVTVKQEKAKPATKGLKEKPVQRKNSAK